MRVVSVISCPQLHKCIPVHASTSCCRPASLGDIVVLLDLGPARKLVAQQLELLVLAGILERREPVVRHRRSRLEEDRLPSPKKSTSSSSFGRRPDADTADQEPNEGAGDDDAPPSISRKRGWTPRRGRKGRGRGGATPRSPRLGEKRQFDLNLTVDDKDMGNFSDCSMSSVDWDEESEADPDTDEESEQSDEGQTGVPESAAPSTGSEIAADKDNGVADANEAQVEPRDLRKRPTPPEGGTSMSAKSAVRSRGLKDSRKRKISVVVPPSVNHSPAEETSAPRFLVPVCTRAFLAFCGSESVGALPHVTCLCAVFFTLTGPHNLPNRAAASAWQQ